MTESSDIGPRLRVRPYLVTKGRTRSDVELSLETLVQASSEDEKNRSSLSVESAEILTMSAEAISLAEISAHLKLPLQVVRVLVGDLVEQGQLSMHQATTDDNQRPDLALLERVLDGLQSL